MADYRLVELGLKVKKRRTPISERQFIQHQRGAGWMKAITLPSSQKVLERRWTSGKITNSSACWRREERQRNSCRAQANTLVHPCALTAALEETTQPRYHRRWPALATLAAIWPRIRASRRVPPHGLEGPTARPRTSWIRTERRRRRGQGKCRCKVRLQFLRWSRT